MSVTKHHGISSNSDTDASEHLTDAVLRYENFLLAQGESPEAADRQAVLFAVFLATELPDLTVLEAVQQLRELVPIFMGGKSNAPPYPGRRKGPHPIEFFDLHYAAAAKEGHLGPGQLAILDRRLYNALTEEFQLKGPHATVGEFFESLRETPIGWQDRIATRTRACANVLGVEPDKAVRFFAKIQRKSATTADGPGRG